MGGRRWAVGIGAGALAAHLASPAVARQHPSAATALTLSGLPSAPRGPRALPVRGAAVGIRFRAPADAELATVHLSWRRSGAGCTVTLHGDAGSAPGAPLAAGAIDPGTGWTSARVAASLAEGSVYHLVVDCPAAGDARLEYVLDDAAEAVTAGVWRLERLGPHAVRARRPPVSPLFALTFADGTWWGHPYDAAPVALRVCGGEEVSAVVVPVEPVSVAGVELLRVRGPRPSVHYRIDTEDGVAVLEGTLAAAGQRLAPTAPAAPTELAAGTAYVLRLAADSPSRAPCIRIAALETALSLGPQRTGVRTLAVRTSTDGGRSWRLAAATTLAATLVSRGNGHSTSTTSTSTTTPTTTTTLAARSYGAPYANGYLGYYDANTIPIWPRRLILMFGEANTQGPLVAPAKQVATAAGNGDARFIFYFSLSDMDSRCSCFDQNFYDSFIGSHPEWILRDASGNKVSTSNGIGRVFAADVGNPGYVDAWAAWALAAMERYGWDGTFADNVFRGYFGSWSAAPLDPRTGHAYAAADYRSDMLAALGRLRALFDARGKILVGNHTSAWDPATFADPTVRDEILAMHGVELEDCVYDFNGNRRNESGWLAQLAYLDFANQHGVRTICSAPGGAMGDPTKRWYALATYLLTKEGFSSVGEINTIGAWWSGLDADLGAPRGRFYCLDPGAALAPTASCPSSGKIYGRDWERGRVLVNPTAATTVTVPLGTTLLWQGAPVTAITLPPGSGAVLVRP